jgi:hypothetical protein
MRDWPKKIAGIFAFFVFLSVAGAVCHADTTVTATLDRATITEGETAELTITINGASSEPEIPQVDGLRITRTGQSQQFQFVNGSSSSSLSLIYLIEATRPGKYTIPAVSIDAGNGKTIETEAIPLEVVSAQAQPQGSGNSPTGSNHPGALPDGQDRQTAFLQVDVKKQAYVGERVPVTIKAYFPEELEANVSTLPTLQGDGLIIEQLDSHPRQTSENIEGRNYNVLIWNTTLSGIKEGRYPLQLQLDATLLIAERRRSVSPFGRMDPFSDDLLENFFGGYRKKPIKVVSPRIDLDIRPLPATGQPPDFSGAIGDFSLQVTANPTSVEVGQPFTVTMAITGNGNFERIKAPLFPEQAGWKTYPPSARFAGQTNAGHDKKIFEQAVVIKDGNIREIPSLSFCYFDPQKQQYITRASQPIPLTVTATEPGGPPPAPALKQSSSQPEAAKQPDVRQSLGQTDGKDLLPIQRQMGSFTPSFVPLFARPWFLFTVMLCCLAMFVVLFLFLRRRRYAGNPEHARKQQMRRLAEKAIPEIIQAIEAGDSGLFLHRCRSMIQQQLGILWRIAPETITQEDLAARLDPSSALLEIITAAEKNAYAEHSLSVEKMRGYVEKLQQECAKLV